MGEFSAGSVIGRSFAIWLKNLVPFTLLSLIVFSPLFGYTFVFSSGELTVERIQRYTLIIMPLTMVLGFIATGAMTYGVFQQLRGQPASIGKCLGVGLARMFPILGVGLMMGLALMAGLIALIVPGLIVLAMLWVAVPVAIVERPGVLASLSRSAELTKGHRWSAFGVIFLVLLVNWGVGQIVQKIFLGDLHGMTADQIIHALKVFLVANVVQSAILAPLQAVSTAVGYHDLRVAKEGVQIDQLASVFD